MSKTLIVFLAAALWVAGPAFAAHPLITDDTGTQGKGKSQIEVNAEYSHDEEREAGATVRETGAEAVTVISYGAAEAVDVVFEVPYVWYRVTASGSTVAEENGLSDIVLALKWRFLDREKLSFALKPAVILPTGDEEKGLGNGKASYGMTFIATAELDPLVFHVNAGYTHNEYRLAADEQANRKEIWHASAAVEFGLTDSLLAVGNVGIERNADKASDTHPAFVLAGIIYSMTDNFDLDAGIKAGVSSPEADYALLAGLAWRF